MKLKKVLAVLSSAALMSTLTAQVASASAAPEDVYNYVALGDSIGSGYGLETSQAGNLGADKALIITEDLIKDPVKNAFPQKFFDKYLKEAAAEYGYTATATNLCATAYRAEDVAKVLVDDGFVGAIAQMLIGAGDDTEAALKAYHQVFTKYLADADLVSIELGGDDMLMSAVWPMFMPAEGQSPNPVLSAIGMGMIMCLLGVPADQAFTMAAGMIIKNKDNITPEVLAEAAEYMQGIAQNSDAIAANAASYVATTIDEVREIADDPTIAVLSMFNPYNTSASIQAHDQKVAEALTVAQAVYAKASEDYTGRQINSVADFATVKLDKATVMTQKLDADVNDFQSLIDSLDEEDKARIQEVLDRIAEEIAYPMAQMMAGDMVDPQIQVLNGKLKAIAEEKGCEFVDTYGYVPSDGDFDPHPTADGHEAIADCMWYDLKNRIIKDLGGEVEPDPVIPDIVGDITFDFVEKDIVIKTGSTKQLKLTVTSGNLPDSNIDLDYWTFTSSNPDVCAVDDNGMIKAKKAGKATIHGFYGDDEVICNVTVVSVFPAATPVSANPSTDPVARDKVTGYVTTVAESSSAGPIAATGGELTGEENDTPAVVAASVLGVIALGFVVVSRKRRHS